jgi:uncharacterized protein YxjI
MRFVLRERLFGFGDDFTIQDEYGRDVFFVDGKAISIGDKLSFQDMAGNELASIKQKLIALRPTYEIYRDGQHAATVNKALFSLFRDRFSIDVPGPDDLEARGSFLDHEYEFTRGGRTVARVSKSWFSFRDTYGVEVADDEDALLILATAVVIDLVSHEQEEQRQRT